MDISSLIKYSLLGKYLSAGLIDSMITYGVCISGNLSLGLIIIISRKIRIILTFNIMNMLSGWQKVHSSFLYEE